MICIHFFDTEQQVNEQYWFGKGRLVAMTIS